MYSCSTISFANGVLDPQVQQFFPLQRTEDVVKIFQYELCKEGDPDLTLLSTIIGYIEINLTSNESLTASNSDIYFESLTDKTNSSSFPVMQYKVLNDLYKKFQEKLKNIEKPKPRQNSGNLANRAVIKKVSDIIYYSLIRSTHKDKAHLQNLYSYLTTHKLDSFGVAIGVVAGMQILGYKDVHLSISEDHVWVNFNTGLSGIGTKNRSKVPNLETIEVTWHGKGNEDKRGQDTSSGVESRSWLYLSGNVVVCDRFTEVAAIVSAINIALTANSDCLELAELQQALLWLLYDLKHLEKYPMSLGNLGELEEVSATGKRKNCEEIYKEAIISSKKYYENHHVYPYTYQGNYYYRQMNYKEAFASWANASDVIRLYTYSRDDEEIYKEFLDIANEMIPYIVKTETTVHSESSILKDSHCFANLLRFYDGICQWEEGSLTPILHIGWAKPLVNTISKFDFDIRSKVIIHCSKDSFPSFKSKNLKNFSGSKTELKTSKGDLTHASISSKSTGKKKNQDSNQDGASDALYHENHPIVYLYSYKMKGLKDLLAAEKLNTHAISLQVTAQSHFASKKNRSTACISSFYGHTCNNFTDKTPINQTIIGEKLETCSKSKRSRRD